MADALETLVVGSVALDSVRTPAGSREEILGGSASFFSIAASRYVPVRLVAVAGTDFPEEYRGLYRDQGIDTEGLQIVEGKTFRWSGVYSEDMNDRETLRTDLNVFEEFHPRLPESYRESPCVLLANIDPDLQLEVLDQMSAPRLVALDTMNLWIHTKRSSLLRVLSRVDIFFINDAEAKLLTGRGSVVDAAQEIRDLGPKQVIVKRGEHGSLTLSDSGWFALPAFPVRTLLDPTGAGDAFAGGTLGWLAARGGTVSDRTLRSGIAHGTAVASHVVEHFSVEGLVSLTAEQIEKRVRSLWEICRFEIEVARS